MWSYVTSFFWKSAGETVAASQTPVTTESPLLQSSPSAPAQAEPERTEQSSKKSKKKTKPASHPERRERQALLEALGVPPVVHQFDAHPSYQRNESRHATDPKLNNSLSFKQRHR